MISFEKKYAEYPMEEFIDKVMSVQEVLGYCKENYCGHFGKCWSCPPYDFDTIEYMKQYSRIKVLGIKACFSEEDKGRTLTKEELGKLTMEAMMGARGQLDEELRAEEEKTPGSEALLGGACTLCGRQPCAKATGEECRHKDKMRYSIESLGGLTNKVTEEMLGYEMLWIKDGILPDYLTSVGALMIK